MNRKQANEEAQKIIDECIKKHDEITKKAKEQGLWKCGLDTNRELFKEVDKEYFAKLQELAKQIDE